MFRLKYLGGFAGDFLCIDISGVGYPIADKFISEPDEVCFRRGGLLELNRNVGDVRMIIIYYGCILKVIRYVH